MTDFAVDFLGIDVGKFFGANLISGENGGIISSHIKLYDIPPPEKIKLVIVEKVHSSPLMGVVGAFSFGKSAGQVEGYLDAKGYRWVYVTPQKWQELTAGYIGESPKERARAFAEKTWGLEKFILPRCTVPHQGLVDSAVIGYYGRLKWQELLLNPMARGRPKKKLRPMKF